MSGECFRTVPKTFWELFSGSFFHPQPPSVLIFHLNLGARSESLVRKAGFPYKGSGSPGGLQWEQFFPNQVLLSKNFRSRPECRQKSLVRNSVVGALQFPSAVVLNAVVRRNTQMCAKERKRAQTQVRKRAQKGAKERNLRFRVKSANNQV